ncbi:S24 family peptidase [bacterium]|nr:S24 family peptidase [bacterium]
MKFNYILHMERKFYLRLSNLIELSSQTKRYFSKAIGMHETHFSSMLKGRLVPPPYDQCVKLLDELSKYVNISPEEREEFLRLAGEERIPDKEKPFIPHVIKSKPIRIEDVGIPVNKVPFIPMEKVYNIYTTNNLDECATEYMISHLGYNDLFTTKVTCDSMLYEFRPGEIVFIRTKLLYKNDDYVIAIDLESKESFLRQYKDYGETKVLRPLNPAFKEIFFDNKRYKIVGPVIGKFTSMG